MRKPDFTRRVAVTGMGLVSPIGDEVDTVWSNLVDGVSGLKRITYWDPEPYACKVAGEVPDFDPNAWMNFKEVRRTDRNVVLGVARSEEGPGPFRPRGHGRATATTSGSSSARAAAAPSS